MRDNEVRNSLHEYPNLALPAPPRFDHAATAAARRVEPLPKRRFAWVYDGIRMAPNHWKLLVFTAFISLTTGGVGGMLIKDGQQSLSNESTLNSVTGEYQSASGEPENVEATVETRPDIMPSPVEQPRQSKPRLRPSRLQEAELEDEDADDEDDDADRKRKKDDDDDHKRKVADDDDDEDRREKRKRKDDDERVHRSRRAAILLDVMRMRRP